MPKASGLHGLAETNDIDGVGIGVCMQVPTPEVLDASLMVSTSP